MVRWSTVEKLTVICHICDYVYVSVGAVVSIGLC